MPYPGQTRSKIRASVCIALAALLLSACSALTTINTLSPNDGARVTTDLAYGPAARNRLDIYRPRAQPGADDATAATAPVVLFFYGGNWNSGERADYAFIGRALASRGIVAVVADYRLSPDVHYPEILRDSALALAWTLREAPRYGGDIKRLYVMGHSAGAYNAAMLALDPRWLGELGLSPALLRGWIGLAGPYDFLPIKVPAVKPVFYFPDTPADSQPINHLGAAAPRTLLIAARHDKLVDPLRNTAGLATGLRAAGVPVTTEYFDHVSHASLVGSIAAPLRFLAPTLDDIAHFVNEDGVAPRAENTTLEKND
jgi:acetyl esterase/lipase